MTQQGVRRLFKWLNRDDWTLEQLCVLGNIGDRMLRQRLEGNNWVVTERILNPKHMNKLEVSLEQNKGQTNILIDGITLSEIAQHSGLTYHRVKSMIYRGLTPNQIIYGVFGDEKNGKSILDGWLIAMNALPHKHDSSSMPRMM